MPRSRSQESSSDYPEDQSEAKLSVLRVLIHLAVCARAPVSVLVAAVIVRHD